VNPAYSVILFTTASGAGYGLLFLLGLVGISHGRASSFAFSATTMVVALGLITIGLLSSTLHLGHPERAWRAFSQWRSSWLSREGIFAVVTYPFAMLFALSWSGIVDCPRLITPLGVATAIMCIATVYCTGMIYASLRTIRQWKHALTVPAYLAFALATGACLLSAIALPFGRLQAVQLIIASAAILMVIILKLIYWRSIDAEPRTRTTGHATGLGENVRQWELPHTAINFIQKEMGFVVARKHAQRLRNLTLLLLVLALVSVLSALVIPPFAIFAALLSLAASAVERWLFFAEAEHISMLYYGLPKA
jgi:sulfite dehydrogenase (quinone) subunit SoeC